jgi:hypothetical protein
MNKAKTAMKERLKRWRSRSAYIETVSKATNCLLAGLELSRRDNFIRGAHEAIEMALREQIGVYDQAVTLASILFSNTIETDLSAEQRSAMLNELTAWSNAPGDVPITHDFLKASCNADLIASSWSRHGWLTNDMGTLIMSEVIGALRGKTREERTAARFQTVFAQLPSKGNTTATPPKLRQETKYVSQLPLLGTTYVTSLRLMLHDNLPGYFVSSTKLAFLRRTGLTDLLSKRQPSWGDKTFDEYAQDFHRDRVAQGMQNNFDESVNALLDSIMDMEITVKRSVLGRDKLIGYRI